MNLKIFTLPFYSINDVSFLQDIDYDGFRKFLDTFLEVRTPEDLCRHLFLSFVRRSVKVEGKAFKEMAVLSSTTACAPITSHNKGKFY